MQQLEVVVAVLAAVAVLTPLAQRVSLPYPVVLTVFGLGVALIPGLPTVHVDPQLLLPLFLPPLLYSASQGTSLAEIRSALAPLLFLAVGLVIITALVVAAVAHALVPGLPWAVAFVLGAIVSPPDPVAATSISQQLRLPRRLVTVLEGEGLFNDATALVLYGVGLDAAVGGHASLLGASARLAYAAPVSVAIGLAVGWVARQLLGRIELPAVENTLVLFVPYAAYLPADAARASGVLAVLTMGLYLNRHRYDVVTPSGRLQGRAFWDMIDFILTGLAFVLIGLELRQVLPSLRHSGLGSVLTEAGVVCLTVIGVRFALLLPLSRLSRLVQARQERGRQRSDAPGATARRRVASTLAPSWRESIVLSWAGMRGVVSLATALSLPFTTTSGAAFPRRATVVVAAFAVIVVTLVGQGLTLPALLRRLGVVGPAEASEREEAATRAALVRAALRRLDELAAEQELPDEVVEGIRSQHNARLERLTRDEDTDDEVAAEQARSRVGKALLEAERAELLRLQAIGEVDAVTANRLLHRLDVRSLYFDPGR
ncbi:MAG: Na+/H+ antiporter [Acidimicrobiales bacterium]